MLLVLQCPSEIARHRERFSARDSCNHISWVPPETLPENILIAIRDQLASIFDQINRIKSRSSTQSSPTTGDEGGDEGLRKEEMYGLFSEPPRKA